MSKKKGIQPGLRSLSKIEKILTVRNPKGRIICDRSH